MRAFIFSFLCCLAFLGKVEGGNGREFDYRTCEIPKFLRFFQPLNPNACPMVRVMEISGHLVQIAGRVVRFCDDKRQKAKAAECASEPNSHVPNPDTTVETVEPQFETSKDDNTSVTSGDFAIQILFLYYILTEFKDVNIVAEETINGLKDKNYLAAKKLLEEVDADIETNGVDFEEHERWFRTYLEQVNTTAIVEGTGMSVENIPANHILFLLDALDATRELLRGEKNKLAVTTIVTFAVQSNTDVTVKKKSYLNHIPFAGILYEHFPTKAVNGVTPPGRMTCVFDYLVAVHPCPDDFVTPVSKDYVPVSTGNLLTVTQLIQYVPDAWPGMQAVISKMKSPKTSAVVQLKVNAEHLYLSGGAGKKSILLCLNSEIAAAVWPHPRCSQHDIAFLLAIAKAFKLKVTDGKGEDIPLICEDKHSGVVRPDGVIATKIMTQYAGWHDALVGARKTAIDEIVEPYVKWVDAEAIRQQKQQFNDVFLANHESVVNGNNKIDHNPPPVELVNAMLSIEAKARIKPPVEVEGKLKDIQKAQLEWYKWIKTSLRELESLKSASNACPKSSEAYQDNLQKYGEPSKIYSFYLKLVAWFAGKFSTLTEHEVTAIESVEECAYKYQQAQMSAENALKALLNCKVDAQYEENAQSRKACETELNTSITEAENFRATYILARDKFCGAYGVTLPAA